MASATTKRTVAADPGPRLLLVGRPGAGKSALLQALLRAASEPSLSFKGRLNDVSGALVQAKGSGPTQAEIVAYAVQFEPEDATATAWTATLLDCNGAVAQDYLVGRRSLDARGELASALWSADTVILIVDAAGGAPQLEKDLASFGEFFRRLEEKRGRRAEIADLPVYLVLAKCDLLARPEDTLSRWIQRIEEGKRRVAQKFEEFLESPGAPTAFGEIDLKVWAVADRRPALGDRPGRNEPYGVAELFQQALASARTFRERREHASRNLSSTVMGMTMLVAVFGLAAAGLAFSSLDASPRPLTEEVGALLPGTASGPAERLRGSSTSALQARLDALSRIQNEEGYDRLPTRLRSEADAYSRELAAYLQATREFEAKRKSPIQAQNSQELQQNEEVLNKFALPTEYADAWRETRLAKRLADARAEYARAHRVIAEESGWLRQQIRAGEALQERGAKIRKQLQTDGKPPGDIDAWLVDASAYDQPRSRHEGHDEIPGLHGLRYESLDKFQPIRQDLEDWHALRAELRSLRTTIEARLKRGR